MEWMFVRWLELWITDIQPKAWGTLSAQDKNVLDLKVNQTLLPTLDSAVYTSNTNPTFFICHSLFFLRLKSFLHLYLDSSRKQKCYLNQLHRILLTQFLLPFFSSACSKINPIFLLIWSLYQTPLLSANLITTNMSLGFMPIGLVIRVPSTGSQCSFWSRSTQQISPWRSLQLAFSPSVEKLSYLLSFSGFLSAFSSHGDTASIICFLVTSFSLLHILFFLLPPFCCHSDFFLPPLIICHFSPVAALSEQVIVGPLAHEETEPQST